MGLLVFNGPIVEVVPLGSGRQHKANVMTEIKKIESGGGTPLHDAVTKGYTALITQARRQLGYGEYYLVVLTDGEANPGQDPGGSIDHITAYSPVNVHTIGFCIGSQHSLNRPGKTIYAEAGDLAELRKGFEGVLAEAPKFDVASFK